jgi:ribosomal protein S18 acetylase RimI-like enzyme
VSFVKDKEYDIRYTNYSDLCFLKKFLAQKANEPYYSAVNEKEREVIARNWIGFYRFKASLTAIFKQEPIGFATLFLMPYKKVCHIAMLYIVVDENFQKKGVGDSLLRNIENQAKRQFNLDSIHLEVVKGAPVESLLIKSGYEKLFEQEAFFNIETKEVARVLYEKSLGQESAS